METKILRLLCGLLLLAAGINNSNAVTISWVTVGNPGNAADTTGFGSAADTFLIGEFETTNAQYAEFLNTVDSTGVNPNGLYHGDMGSTPRGGISFVASNANGMKYVTRTNMDLKPVNLVSWFDVARMANWMHNGQGTGSTETGSYDMMQATPTRLAGATIFLPSEDEWYKVAFHDPGNAGADGNGTVDYWLYPTMSDAQPILATANAVGDISNPGTNVANYDLGADWNGQNGNVTTVGSAGANSASFYGTLGQAGNVAEWIEDIDGTNGVLRGGSWGWTHPGDGRAMRSGDTGRLVVAATGQDRGLGFRFAAVPEPSRALLSILGIAAIGLRRRRS